MHLLDEIGNSFSPAVLTKFLGLALIVVVLYIAVYAVSNVYFHPLKSIPGPKLWAATHMPRHYHEFRGTIDWRICSFHDKYGDAVRISPDSLSFSTSAALKDAYGYGKHNLERDMSFSDIVQAGAPARGIIQSYSADHARMRRQLSHAFSEKALREQEPIIQSYVDTLVEQLKENAASGAPVELSKRIQYTTSDITSELAFGTTFNTLKDDRFHHQMELQGKAFHMVIFVRIMRAYPFTAPVIKWFTSPAFLNQMKTNREYVRKTVMERLALGVAEEKRDFLSYVLKHKDEDVAMSEGEILETSRSLILAGADTTRTLLTAVLYYLLQTPHAMKRVTEEVRSAFEQEDEITFVNATTRLPYMLACLDEGLRIHPPATSGLFSRRTPPGSPMTIAGHSVAESTSVVVQPLVLHRSPRNFFEPHVYHPERWLPSAQAPDSPFRNDDHTALQPFSSGPRNCIGRNLAYSKMRNILARLLWNFDFELCPESKDWNQQKIYLVWEDKPLMCRVKIRGQQ